MLIAFLLIWIGSVACAAAGCTVPALFLGLVMLGLIFRWELDRLLAMFGPRAPSPPVTDG